MSSFRHFSRCLGAVLRKNFTLKSRQWISATLELMLPVALMFLLIWIRSEVQKEYVPARNYVHAPANNPTWFSAQALNVSMIPGLPPALQKQLEALCESPDSALCPEIFANGTWNLRKEHYTGAALDGLLPLHMAQRNLRLGIVGTAGKSLFDFISALPGYSTLIKYFSSQESYDDYLSDHDYGFSKQNPALFGAIVVQSAATCPSGGSCSGDWEILIHLNTTGPSTSTADIKGATDINTKLMPEVSSLNKGLKMSTSRIYWSGGLSQSLGLGLPTGGLVDLQSLVYAWIFNTTGAYQFPNPSELPKCECMDPKGQATEDFSKCNVTSLFQTAVRSLTPQWSTAILGSSAGCLGRLSGLLPVSVREIPFPTPAYTQDPFATFVKSVFGLFFVLVFIWPLTRIMKSLVEDKEARINEVMKMMGMPAEAILLGWYVTYAVLWLIPAALMTLVCWNSVFQHSDKFLVFLFFWIFGVCVVTLCSFIAVFFSKAKTASVVGALLFFLLYFPFLFVSDSGASVTTKALSCLSPPVALSIGAGLIAEFESAGVGVRWSNINESIDNSSMGQVLLMLLVDTLIFALLAWYLDKVLVVGFGTRQPWYFPCSKRFWSPDTSAMSQEELRDVEDGFDDLQPSNARYEAVPESMATQRSVLVRELCKEFKTADGKVLKAVQEVSLNLYSGQIFCLLGHNGAGKTTTINMLSGMLPVSSGDAIVYGKSVSRDMQQIRKVLGVCPQHDVIWSGLTVREHLEFFAQAKGMNKEALEAEVNGLIQDVSLQEKENSLAGTLSGGQKRRLSAAIALIGGSQVVFLDEPSSGVDPFSRRQLWDCLREKKNDRTLILTTHFMDEAEELGDRIAIMAAGRVKCVGSALFLKSQYGVGYTLTIAKVPHVTAEQSRELRTLMSSKCSKAEILSDVGAELTYRMPFEESSSFPALFESLEQQPQRYGVELFGVSVTTLEEVFLRVGRDHTEADVAADERLQQASFVRQISEDCERARSSFRPSEGSAREVSATEPLHPTRRETPSASFGKHVHALLTKRYHNARRDRKAWCCQIVLPLIFLLAALLTMRFAGIGNYQAASLSPEQLPGPQHLLVGAGFNVSPADATALLQSGVVPVQEVEDQMNATTFSEYLEKGYYRNDGIQRWGAMRVVSMPDWSSPNASHQVGRFEVAGFSSPGKVTSASRNFTVPVGTLWEEKATVLGASIPLSKLNNRLQVDLFWNSSARDALPMFYQTLNEAALRKALGTEVLKDSKIKMSNQPFPLTSAQKDLTNTQTSLNLALGFAFIPASVGAFVVLERETGSKHLQVISGVNFVSYWFSTWIWDILNYLVAASLSILLIAIFGVDSLISPETLPWTCLSVLMYGVSCTSFTYMLSFLFNSHTAAQNLLLIVYLFTGGILMIVTIILSILPSTKDLAQNVLIYLFRILPNFCLADSLTNLITRGNPGLWLDKGCPFEGCAPYDLVITGYDLLYMGVGSIFWFLATLLLELAFATPKLRAWFQFRHVDAPHEGGAPLDRQVQLEKERVESGSADEEMVVLKGLRKVFPGRQGAPPKVAVEEMYFGIPEGECFGYLGLNGAGKTTTMKMLTGEELCTSGDATLGGFDIKTQQNQVRRLIGYCPQFDALIGTLTAREHLTLFARIKGMPDNEVHQYVDSLLDQLTLRPYADKQAFSFSGGTRRKLSLGLSLVGDPRCVFLDEPTTGVDPESRRFMWKLISSTMLGRAVILTTHSMEECEALCSRIGIMVNGRLVCLGSASQLKATHGYGYQFEVTFESSADLVEAHSGLKGFLEKQFTGVRVEESLPTRPRARYRLPKGQKPISAIFRLMEERKSTLRISEYSVSETTLEQLFIQFAKHQVEEGQEEAAIQADSSSEEKQTPRFEVDASGAGSSAV